MQINCHRSGGIGEQQQLAAVRAHIVALRFVGSNANLSRPGRTAKDLVSAGLWVPEGDGYRINDYLVYNHSKAEVERKRQEARDRMRAGREKGSGTDGSRERSGEGSRTTALLNAKAFNASRDSNPPDSETAARFDCSYCGLILTSTRELDKHLDVVHWEHGSETQTEASAA
jgi:hypothetical protein